MKAWLKERGFASCGAAQTTHVFMDGGKACIPREAVREFHKRCAIEVASGRGFMGIERTNKRPYRMFADFDIKGTMDMSRLLAHAIECLPPQLRVGRVVACTRKPLDGKTGAHLVWTDDVVIVNDKIAMALRNDWVKRCNDAIAPWNDIIDAAVYQNNGLRMAFSLKKGQRDPHVIYLPTHTITFDPYIMIDEVPASQTPPDALEIAEWLDTLSIHASAVDASTNVDCAGNDVKPPVSKPVRRVSKRATNIPATDLPSGVIPDMYHNLTVVSKSAKQMVIGTSSKECLIAGRTHGSNHVYLVIKPNGCTYQKCHSAKCAGKEVIVSNPKLTPDELRRLGVAPMVSLAPPVNAAAAAALWMKRRSAACQ